MTGAGLEPLGKRLWEMIADAHAIEQDARSAEPVDDPFSGATLEPKPPDFREDPTESMHDDRELS